MPEEVLITAIVFLSILTFVKMILDYATRRKLIEKGLVDEKVKYLFSNMGQNNFLSNIKWGIVLLSIGIAFFYRQFADYRVEGETVFGLMFILMGAGFFIYYFIAKSQHERKQQEDQSNKM